MSAEAPQAAEIRCPKGVMFGILRGARTIAFKCHNRRCGAGPGVVVLHTFDINTSELLRTDRFREPTRTNGRKDRP